MTETEIAEAIHKKLEAIANDIESAGKTDVKSADLINALENPWICIKQAATGEWRLYNTSTQTWGDDC